MNPNQWEQDRTLLRVEFNRGTIANSSRQELVKHLIHLAKEPDKADYELAETKRFTQVVVFLLHAKIEEELHEKSHRIAKESIELSKRAEWISTISAAAAVGSVLIALWLGYKEHRNNAATTWNAPQSQHLLLNTQSLLPLTNTYAVTHGEPANPSATTNSKPVPSNASTNH